MGGAAGGAAAPFATDPGMVFPNGLAFTAGGDLLVTDSAAGTVFKVTPAGAVTPWITDALLAGQKDFCGAGLGSFDIGANGIAIDADGTVWVANNDKASIVKIPVSGGAAGAPELFAGPDCDALGGADGLVVDADGSLIGLAIGEVGGQRSLFVTSFALLTASAGEPAHPALLARPLPAP
jgi:sugar lactone lactonase YvrE